jgi:pimeloyl-ACP methyl ester carboxylesterase
MTGDDKHIVTLPGARLSLVVHVPPGRRRVPCVVACHGLRASKDSDKYLLLGAELPAAGLALARFDFRGCGESTGDEEDTTIATRVEDLEAVLKFLAFHRRLDGRFGLLGSSLGGYVALHVAAARGDGMPVVTWNAPSNLGELMDTPSADATGFGIAFFQELATHRYDNAPTGVGGHLVIQAEADDVVPVEHGATLHARAKDPCDLVIIPGADHRLSDIAHRRAAVAASLDWFGRFFKEAA